MPFSTYSELKAAIPGWMYRDDVEEDTQAADFIKLAECELNRKLEAVEVDTTLSGTVGSRSIGISSLPLVQPVALYIKDNGDERLLSFRADGTFAYDDTAGEPSIWAIDGENIDFDRPCDEAYSFRLRYQKRFALSDAAPTNWLLDNHPDLYLAAAIVWGTDWEDEQSPRLARWTQKLASTIPQVKREIAQKKRGVLRVDRALWQSSTPLHRPVYDGEF